MTDLLLEGPAATVRMRRDEGSEYVTGEVWNQDCYRLARLAPGRVFVDIGANVGAATLAAIAHGATNVIAVEPDYINYTQLQDNVAASGVAGLVTVHHAAVGRPLERVQVHRPASHPEGCYGSSWTAPSTDQAAAALAQRPLDEFLPVADALLKIDTEGAEYEILAACGVDVLAARVEHIVMEWHDFPQRGVDAYDQLPQLFIRLLRYYDVEVIGAPNRGGLLFATRR